MLVNCTNNYMYTSSNVVQTILQVDFISFVILLYPISDIAVLIGPCF